MLCYWCKIKKLHRILLEKNEGIIQGLHTLHAFVSYSMGPLVYVYAAERRGEARFSPIVSFCFPSSRKVYYCCARKNAMAAVAAWWHEQRVRVLKDSWNCLNCVKKAITIRVGPCTLLSNKKWANGLTVAVKQRLMHRCLILFTVLKHEMKRCLPRWCQLFYYWSSSRPSFLSCFTMNPFK